MIDTIRFLVEIEMFDKEVQSSTGPCTEWYRVSLQMNDDEVSYASHPGGLKLGQTEQGAFPTMQDLYDYALEVYRR